MVEHSKSELIGWIVFKYGAHIGDIVPSWLTFQDHG